MHNDSGIGIDGLLSAVGLGPGDPELLTVKALGVLEKADLVLTPKSSGKERSIARDIITGAVGHELNYRDLPYTMTRSKAERERYWDEVAEDVLELLKEGRHVVFTTLGDLSLYSTFQYFRNSWNKLNTGVSIFTVPGISSFQAAAAVLENDIALGKETFCVTPLPENPKELDKLLLMHDTVVIMKVGRHLGKLREYLKLKNLLSSSSFVSRVTMEDEVKVISMEDLTENTEGYLSIVLVNTGGGAT